MSFDMFVFLVIWGFLSGWAWVVLFYMFLRKCAPPFIRGALATRPVVPPLLRKIVSNPLEHYHDLRKGGYGIAISLISALGELTLGLLPMLVFIVQFLRALFDLHK